MHAMQLLHKIQVISQNLFPPVFVFPPPLFPEGQEEKKRKKNIPDVRSGSLQSRGDGTTVRAGRGHIRGVALA